MVKRGKKPSLISGASGKPNIVVAQKKRKCSYCDESIAGGFNCYEIPNPRTSFSGKKTFCLDCFSLILQQTKEDLAAIEAKHSTVILSR